ncbi:MAG: hypothetical protein LBM75_05475 [Myxococcales bacterium]|nr:hypothetical protein [Myxococcales bacterium]
MKTSQKTSCSNESGAAVVETALLLLILVPLLFYSAFSGEAGMLLLEMQEQPIASIWDYSTYPYQLEKTRGAGGWLNETGKQGDSDKELISTFNRFQYADDDSSFTNAAKFNGGKMDIGIDGGPEYYMTNAFVQSSTCDEKSCLNHREKWSDPLVNEVVCGVADQTLDGVDGRMVGGFVEGNIPYIDVPMAYTGIAFLMDKSPGALVVCQQKARLKNYLLPEKFLPEFSSTKLYEKDRYTGSDRNVDDRTDYNDIVVRHRIYLLTDTWGLIEPVKEHQDSRLSFAPDITNLRQTFSITNLFPPRTRFQNITNGVRNSITSERATTTAVSYMTYAIQNKIAIPLAIPDVDASGIQGKIQGYVRTLTDAIGLPNLLGLNMVAYYPKHELTENRRSQHLTNKYQYAPTLDVSGLGGIVMAIIGKKPKYHTTPLLDDATTEYKTIYTERSNYYMGAKQSNAD